MSMWSEIWQRSLETENDLEALKVEAAKKEVLAAAAEREAKVAQELAIAERIGTALEVTIEEFYEYKGETEVGAGVKERRLRSGFPGQDSGSRNESIRSKGLRRAQIAQAETFLHVSELSSTGFFVIALP